MGVLSLLAVYLIRVHFTCWVITCHLVILLLRSSLPWPWEPFQALLCPLDVPRSFRLLSTCFTSGAPCCSRPIWCHPCPSPGISHFSREPCPFLGE